MAGTHYAECTNCDETFADREAARAHASATLAATGVPGIAARGHAYRVVNPTPEEQAASRARYTVDRAIEDAQQSAFEDLDRAIRRGNVTEESITDALRWYSDFADAWDEWRKDGDR